MNRVESINYVGAGILDIEYDHMGRATSFKMGQDVISVEYQGPNRVARIFSRASGTQWSPDDDEENEEAARESQDERLALFYGESTASLNPDYGIVGFDELTFRMVTSDPLELGVSGLHEARRLHSAAASLFAEDRRGAMMDFEKPSNPVFQPLEYRSTNCCIHTPVLPKAISPGSGIPQPPGGGFDPDSSFCAPYLPGKPLDPHVEVSPRGSIWYIDNDRNMPTITGYFEASVRNYSGDSSELQYDWEFEGEFAGESDSVGAVNQTYRWKPSSWNGKLFGGHVGVYATANIDGKTYVGASANTIHGENPTATQLRPYLDSPWFFAKLVRAESSCRQFDGFRYGPPVHSSDGGIGLTQLTNPAPDIREIWDWEANITEAKSRLETFETEAMSFWNRQYMQWMEYNTDRQERTLSMAGPPPDKHYGSVTYGYSGAGKRPLSDGIWIKRYNGARAMWIVWENQDWEEWANMDPRVGIEPLVYWEYNESGSYVQKVSEASPCP